MRQLNSGGTAALAAALILAALGGVAFAQEPTGSDDPAPAPLEGATISDAGWWNRLRPQVELPTGQPPAPPTPGVPAGSLVVGASAGDADAVAAIGIDTELAPGATVESFELLLREVTDEGANLNSTFAVVVACPITGFWIGGENGVWETRPTYDCSLAEAPGTRAEDGAWTFDLRAIGQLWSDGAVSEDGVALVEDVEAPTGFRTVYAGLADLAVGVRLVATGGDEADDPFAGGSTFGDATSGSGLGSSGGGTGVSSGGGFRPPTATGGALPAPAGGGAPPAAPADDTAAEPSQDVSLPTVPIAGPGSPLGTLPWWTWPVLAVILAVALVAMVALGPSGEPALAGAVRGVTRAIEARTKSEEP